MLTALLVAVLAADPGAAPSTLPGGVVAPAALPPGTIAMYAQVGAPAVGVGYRQGFAPFELEARALFDILAVSALIDVGAKAPVLSLDAVQVSAGGSLGLSFNSGARYFDPANFASIALRPRLVGTVSVPFSALVSGLGQLEVPLAISLTVRGVQFTPTAGLGAEINLGETFSLLAMVALGVDVIKEPLGVTQARLAWGVRLGLGYRLF
jgi:hypothetical protein